MCVSILEPYTATPVSHTRWHVCIVPSSPARLQVIPRVLLCLCPARLATFRFGFWDIFGFFRNPWVRVKDMYHLWYLRIPWKFALPQILPVPFPVISLDFVINVYPVFFHITCQFFRCTPLYVYLDTRTIHSYCGLKTCLHIRLVPFIPLRLAGSTSCIALPLPCPPRYVSFGIFGVFSVFPEILGLGLKSPCRIQPTEK